MNFEIPSAVKTWSQFGHPILMWVLLGLTIYALYSGLQWRRTRTADKDLKKQLLPKDFRTKHYQIGSLILALMVLGTIGGMAVTYINNGKLFVGPHLLAGLGMVGLISISAALVPLMQKGNELARITHITLNAVILGLFGWQAFTGMDIVQRILSKI
ncbi:MAG: DUF4079 domain-containing protein [Microcystis sp. M048S1]|jgi:hypothetical protein|uniref:DUF4079 domain-containing protein n=1 Tax=unclassified Microcystis TaxID=2643300 RepID=UPI00118EE992|nr:MULTISPECIES: DUF4079 domain-containing protein [unclassified Microcystis]MCA2902375.1 DUF4079 domain-containing protein [Microcystis sp. M035S1]MCA2721453.1 DUF4079 domain-containing protein [Microcystis sp. M176S2]MCA2724375.1 DUF4079 domain-containing protein [Microcystis sp. M166S2]MCA2730333.1 DUF4079 domain-containing protein [Microcystis sp. M162S2]MCA2747882.1 DUF4079 domain-containing protein [Microcystis sp. M155S2]